MTARSIAVAAFSVVLAACGASQSDATAPQHPTGQVVVRVDAVATQLITRIAIDVQPANIQRDLSVDASSGTFTSVLVVPVGRQTVNARAYAGAVQVGTGSATVDIVENVTATIDLVIKESGDPDPLPDHTPIIASLVTSATSIRAGDSVVLAATGADPDGDIVTYAWSSSCAGSFSAPGSASTSFTSSAVGTCSLTVTLSARGLSDSRTVSIAVLAGGTGALTINGVYAPRPRISYIGGYDLRTVFRADQSILAGTKVGQAPVSLYVSYDLGTAAPSDVEVSASDDCGGQSSGVYAPSPGYANMTWIAPARAGVCVVRVRVESDGGYDEMPIALIVNWCATSSECSAGNACIDHACAPGRTITGTRLATYWSGAQAGAPVPATSGVSIMALVEKNGGYEWHSGSVSGNGDFAVGVPAGRTLLAVENLVNGRVSYVDTSSTVVDLGFDAAGRPDDVPPQYSTPVTFLLSGLSPWSEGNAIQLTSADFWNVPSWDLDSGVVQTVQTTDWMSGVAGACPLVDAARGDVVYVHQLVTTSIDAGGPRSYSAAARAVALDTVTLADGVPSVVTAALADVPQSGSVTVDWRTTQFEQYLASMGPGAEPSRHHFYVNANSGPLNPLATNDYGTPDLLIMEIEPGAADFTAGPLRYGQFLDATWTEFLIASFDARVPVSAPGGSTKYVSAGIGSRRPYANGALLAPVVSPVRSVKLDSRDAMMPGLTTASVTPVLSWTAPALGDPDYYLVAVYLLRNYSGTTSVSRVYSVMTRNTTLRLPPYNSGWYEEAYVAVIRAMVEPGSRVETAPFREHLPFSWADAVTATWRYVP